MNLQNPKRTRYTETVERNNPLCGTEINQNDEEESAMKSTMKKSVISRVLVMAAVCILAVLSCSAAFADGEWVTVRGESRQAYWRTNGNGNEISVFQVVVKNAPATIYFSQEEGLCYETAARSAAGIGTRRGAAAALSCISTTPASITSGWFRSRRRK